MPEPAAFAGSVLSSSSSSSFFFSSSFSSCSSRVPAGRATPQTRVGFHARAVPAPRPPHNCCRCTKARRAWSWEPLPASRPLISAPKNAARMKSPPQTGSGEAAERPDLVGTESCHYPPASVKLIHGTKTASSWHPARGAGARRLWGGRSAKESSGEPFGDEAPAAACRGSRGSQRVVPGEMVHPHRPRRSGSATSLVGRDGGRAEKDLRSGKASGDAFVLCR